MNDQQWNDEAAWALARQMEGFGAVQESADVSGGMLTETYWIVRIEHFNALANALSAQPRQDDVADKWQPIETAPIDTIILLAFPVAGVIRGRWEADKYGSPPRPYWTNDRERIAGKTATRADHPTHWMPLPAPPEIKATGGK